MITALTQADVVESSCPVNRLPSSVLLADIMMDMTYALTQRLTRHGFGDSESQRLLWRRLSQHLIEVNDRPNGLRHVSIGGGRVVFLVPVKTGASSEYQDVFPPGRAIGLVTRPRSPKHVPEFWHGLSESQWHILLLDWLGHELTLWLSEHTSIKGEGLNRLARSLADEVVRPLLFHVPALQCLLWDSLGFARDLVRHCQRNWARNLVKADAARQAKVIRYWPSRTAWSGSALKLYPLALVLAAGEASAPSPREVRDTLGMRGLSRNAWGLLYRMPAEVIELMAMDLEIFSAPHLQERYLKLMSLWCARLGRTPRYYKAGIRKVACALLWPVRELVLLTCEDAYSVYSSHDRHLAMVMVWERLAGMLHVLRRCTEDPEELIRLQILLQRFSDYLLTSEDLGRQPFQRLHEVIDWFVVEGRRMPIQVFKRPYQQTLNLSMRWHDTQWREAQQRQHDDDVAQSWPVALPYFESDGGSFKALSTSRELALEGQLMQHCVGTYTRSCLEGRSLIYAVGYEGERVGTLEMIADDSGQWELNQFKGVRNQQLAQALTEPASKLHLPYIAFLAALQSSGQR